MFSGLLASRADEDPESDWPVRSGVGTALDDRDPDEDDLRAVFFAPVDFRFDVFLAADRVDFLAVDLLLFPVDLPLDELDLPAVFRLFFWVVFFVDFFEDFFFFATIRTPQ